MSLGFRKMSPDNMPGMNEVVLVCLKKATKPAKIEVVTAIGNRGGRVDSEIMNRIFPAVLRFVVDGFGNKHPAAWLLLGAHHGVKDDGNMVANLRQTQVDLVIDIQEVEAWARMGTVIVDGQTISDDERL